MSVMKGVCESIAAIEDGTRIVAEGFADVQDRMLKSMTLSLNLVHQRIIDKAG
jgi:hypothetical protein